MNYFGNGGTGSHFFGLGLASVAGLSVIFIAIFFIVVALKGYSLWTAAKRDEKWWFIILLVVNTMGILELIYLYFIAKKWDKVDGNNGNANTANTAGTTNTGNTSTSTSNSAPKIVDAEVKNSSGDNSHFVKE